MSVASDPVIRSNQERLAGVVQSVGRRPVDIERRRWESVLVFVAATVVYAWIGHWLVVDMHVVGFETLDRFNRALMVWHNEPAKLAAVGFDLPPLTVLLLVPFAGISALVRSLDVVSLGSAVFAGMTMVLLNTLMRRAQVVGALRVALLVGLGLNPLFVLYAATGGRELIWLAFATAALGALVAWHVTGDIRFVLVAGLCYSLAALAGYSSLAWFVVSALAVGAVLARLGARGTEIEGTTVGFAVPTMYVVALWTVLNLVLVGNPFNWVTSSSDRAADGATAPALGDAVTGTLELVWYGAPIVLVVLPALLFVGVARANSLALWLGILLLVAVVTPAVSALLGLDGSSMMMRDALPLLVLAVVGALWLARSAGTGSTAVAALTAAGLLLSVPWTFSAMKSYEHQGLEAAFVAAVSTGQSQEGREAPDGAVVGYGSEQAMAAWIRANVGEDELVLTDNARTSAVMLMTGRPDRFFDRVDRSDAAWLEAARHPAEHVEYLLLSVDPTGDLLSELYPTAATGADTRLTDAYRTKRYALVRVPPGYQYAAPATEDQVEEDR